MVSRKLKIRLIADFHAKVKTLEDTLMKETSKLESSEPSKMEVSPDKSFDVSKTQDPDQNESCVLGKHVILQSQDSDHSPGSWSQVREQLTTRMESLVSAGVITSKAYREFLKETPLNTREDQQNMSGEQIAQRQWAFNKRIESWIDCQMSDDISDRSSYMEDAQRMDDSETFVSETGSLADSVNTGHSKSKDSVKSVKTVINGSRETNVDNNRPHQPDSDRTRSQRNQEKNATQTPVAGSSNGNATEPKSNPSNQSSGQVAPMVADTNDGNDDDDLGPSRAEFPLDIDTIIQRGLISDPDWMRTRTVVLRVSRQKAYFTITRDQIMTDLINLGVAKSDLLGIGESGTGEWEIYCLTENTAQTLADVGSFLYAGKHNAELYLLGRQTTVIRIHWLPLRVNNQEVYDWVSQFSDEVLDIQYEQSVASKAQGLLTGIRRVRCILREGVARTDVPYDTSLFSEDGGVYRILISVEGRLPKCLKCEKLGHIRRDCKARKCNICMHMTDEHVTATCPYKGQYSTATRTGGAGSVQTHQQQVPRKNQYTGPRAYTKQASSGPAITRFNQQGQNALGGVSENQLAKDLDESFQPVLSKNAKRKLRKNEPNQSQNQVPVPEAGQGKPQPLVQSSMASASSPQEEENYPALVSQSPPVKGQTQYQPKVQVPPGTAFSLEQINGKLADKAVDKKQGIEKSANQRLSTPSGNQKKGDGTSPERPKTPRPSLSEKPTPPPKPTSIKRLADNSSNGSGNNKPPAKALKGLTTPPV